jgi:hypothetical protein
MNATRAANQYQKPGAEQFPVSGCVSTVKRSKRCTKEHTDKDLIMKNIVENQGIKNDKPLALTYEQLKQRLDAVVAENVALKSNLMFWDADNPELPYDSPKEIADDCALDFGQEFEVQVAARMPNRIYRVCHVSEYDCELELVEGKPILTPATNAALAEVEAKAIEKFAAFLDEPIDGKQCFEHAAGLARHFASTLREGRVCK